MPREYSAVVETDDGIVGTESGDNRGEMHNQH